ncbi:MAG: hypothetical protein JXQ27_13520 [Acidobacteria bacterium]|nr:hypothetical protein [Acidobacteriota bacterium]
MKDDGTRGLTGDDGRGPTVGRWKAANGSGWSKMLILFGLVVFGGPVFQAGAAELQPFPEEVLARCRRDPKVLRNDGTYRDLCKFDPTTGVDVFASLFADATHPLDVRVRALLLLPAEAAPEHYARLGREFSTSAAARTEDGAAAINFMTRAVFGRDRRATIMRSLLLPGPDMQGVGEILQSLSGQACHDYLHMLQAHHYPFDSAQIRLLAVTSDEATRRFLYWYVGQANMLDLDCFLAREIASGKPSTYGGRWMRLVLMAFTAGVSEVLRSALPPPEWLDEDKTTKELALESLACLIPSGTSPRDPEVATALLAAAKEAAASDEEEDYRLAAALLLFLHDRAVPLEPDGRTALAALGRLVPDEDARNETFVLAVKVHQRTGLPLPTYSREEVDLFWDRALKTLNHEYLAAVVAVWPDSQRRAQLTEHLLQQGIQASRGNLRFPAKNETWLCVHDAGDWSRCVAALHVAEALPMVAGVLETPWAGTAAEALMTFGNAGLPALRDFIRTSRAGELNAAARIRCMTFCLRQIPLEDGVHLVRELLDNRPTKALVTKALQEMGTRGQEIRTALNQDDHKPLD